MNRENVNHLKLRISLKNSLNDNLRNIHSMNWGSLNFKSICMIAVFIYKTRREK